MVPTPYARLDRVGLLPHMGVGRNVSGMFQLDGIVVGYFTIMAFIYPPYILINVQYKCSFLHSLRYYRQVSIIAYKIFVQHEISNVMKK